MDCKSVWAVGDRGSQQPHSLRKTPRPRNCRRIAATRALNLSDYILPVCAQARRAGCARWSPCRRFLVRCLRLRLQLPCCSRTRCCSAGWCLRRLRRRTAPSSVWPGCRSRPSGPSPSLPRQRQRLRRRRAHGQSGSNRHLQRLRPKLYDHDPRLPPQARRRLNPQRPLPHPRRQLLHPRLRHCPSRRLRRHPKR